MLPAPRIELDWETYSEAGFVWNPAEGKWGALPGAPGAKKGLPIVGAAVYAQHPSAEVLCLNYDGRRWNPHMPPPYDLFAHIAAGGLVEAWNVAFERWIWKEVAVARMGWPPIPDDQWRCAMGKARAAGLPGRLDLAAEVMGTRRKNADGDRLIKKFTMPRNPTKLDKRLRIRPEEDPIDAEHFYQYNDVDVLAEQEIGRLIPDLEGEELEYWKVDLAINARGVHIDLPSVEACCSIVNQALSKYNAELYALTGGTVTAASEIKKLLGWLGAHGVYASSLDEENVDELLKERHRFPPQAMRALEIRQAVGSASVKKVFAMRNRVARGDRLHDLFNYHLARTGRAGGEGPQPTNLPRSGGPICKCGACGRYSGAMHTACPWCCIPQPPGRKPAEWGIEPAEDALQVIACGNLEYLEFFFGDALGAIAGCLRSLYDAAPGHELISSDYSAIEGVVTAMLAGEQWRIDVFRTHGKIYEMSAAKISGIPFAEIMASAGFTDVTAPEWWKAEAKGKHHPLRQTIGKVAELASGFGGWVGSWLAFGAGEFMSEEEIKQGVLGWREASPSIPYLWGGQSQNWQPCLYGLEGMAVAAIQSPGVWFPVMRLDGTFSGVSYICHNDILYCRLPSGRDLWYRRPRLAPAEQSWRGLAISFEGYNSNPKKGAIGWLRMSLYGGLLCENVVQATARDVLRHASINLERAGYPIVLHVYDEIVSEIPESFGNIEHFEAIMNTMPPWAEGWPIRAAGGWRGKRYRKG